MNTFIESNKGKLFTLSDRISIEAGIEKGWSFKKIASSASFCPSFTTAKCELLKLRTAPQVARYRQMELPVCSCYSSSVNSIISSTVQSSFLHIFSIVSIDTYWFFPIRARMFPLIPVRYCISNSPFANHASMLVLLRSLYRVFVRLNTCDF